MNRSQQMATRALERVQAVQAAQRAEYKSLAMKAPVLVHQSGLVQALVFIQSRGAVGVTLLNDLAQILTGNAGQGVAFTNEARNLELSAYLVRTHEVIQALTWLRRFVQIEMGG